MLPSHVSKVRIFYTSYLSYLYFVHILCTFLYSCISILYLSTISVLAAKGVDASEVDKRVERKASVARLTGKLFCIPSIQNIKLYIKYADN